MASVKYSLDMRGIRKWCQPHEKLWLRPPPDGAKQIKVLPIEFSKFRRRVLVIFNVGANSSSMWFIMYDCACSAEGLFAHYIYMPHVTLVS
jgi:hypothetical protein